jgi:phage shock protein E
MKSLLLSTLLLPFLAAPAPAETPAAAKPATPAAAPATAAVKHVEAPEAAKLLTEAAKSPAPPIAVIDVRTPEEFAEGHLKGAQNVDIASPDFAKNLAKLDPSKTYLVHCAAGGRSTRSLSVLEKLGFKSIIHLDGGLNGWKKAGLPLEKPAASPAPAK